MAQARKVDVILVTELTRWGRSLAGFAARSLTCSKFRFVSYPLRAPDLFEILAQLDDGTAQGLRDRALLVVGFTGALRRSELVALDIEDVRWTREGVVLNIRVSQTDQEGRGIEVRYFCPTPKKVKAAVSC